MIFILYIQPQTISIIDLISAIEKDFALYDQFI